MSADSKENVPHDVEDTPHKGLDEKSGDRDLAYVQTVSDIPLSETATPETRFATSRKELYAYYIYYIGNSLAPPQSSACHSMGVFEREQRALWLQLWAQPVPESTVLGGHLRR